MHPLTPEDTIQHRIPDKQEIGAVASLACSQDFSVLYKELEAVCQQNSEWRRIDRFGA